MLILRLRDFVDLRIYRVGFPVAAPLQLVTLITFGALRTPLHTFCWRTTALLFYGYAHVYVGYAVATFSPGFLRFTLPRLRSWTGYLRPDARCCYVYVTRLQHYTFAVTLALRWLHLRTFGYFAVYGLPRIVTFIGPSSRCCTLRLRLHVDFAFTVCRALDWLRLVTCIWLIDCVTFAFRLRSRAFTVGPFGYVYAPRLRTVVRLPRVAVAVVTPRLAVQICTHS